jgi:putative transposase
MPHQIHGHTPTDTGLMRALAVEIHEDWIEQHRYLNMELLREHKKMKRAEEAA